MATVVPPSTTERKTKLANLLAVLARQAHVIGNGSHAPNEYLAAMDQNVRELEAFSAVIYSSNFDLELPGASKAAADADADAEQEFGSSSYASVMVEKEPETSNDLAESTPILVDNAVEEEIVSADAQKEVEAAEAPGESAFDKAWGKAVEDGNTSPPSEDQTAPAPAPTP
jgi:Peroxin-3.